MIKPYNEKISVLQKEIDDKSIQIAKLNSEITKLKTQNDSLASETETKEKANLKQIDTLSNINVSQSKLYEQMESTIKMKEEFEQKRGEMLKAKDKELDEVYEKLEVADKKLKQVTSELKQFKNIIDLIDVDNLDAGDELNNAESPTEEGNQSKINIKELEHKLMLKIKKINDEKDEAVTTKEM